MSMLPRLVIAAPGSGHGKTTVSSGLMGALRAEGLDVAGFKIGPDYIDPGYHALATGRPGRNLDPHLCGDERLVPLLLHGAATPHPADVAIIEGVMGLYDGQIGGEGFASTAHVARVVDAPVVLVVDISHMSRTVAALVHGMITFDSGLRVEGVILNKAGSARHAGEVISALEATGVDVLGVLPRDAGIEAPSRHLGLVPADERDEAAAALIRLSAQVAEHLDLRKLLAIAHRAPELAVTPWDPAAEVRVNGATRPVVAVAAGRAFTFRYAETDELIRAAGCEPVIMDPLVDSALPEGTAGLYLGGGFPEVHAADLAANTALLDDIGAAIRSGMPTVAECAGLLYLCRSVEGRAMVGAIPADATMTPRLVLGYRTAVADTDQVVALAGTQVTGHEFHRTALRGEDLDPPAWLLDGVPHGYSSDPAGTGRPTLHASYLHTHWAGHPQLAQRFCDAVHAYTARPKTAPAHLPGSRTPCTACGSPEGVRERSEGAAEEVRQHERRGQHDLWHHGDAEVSEGLVDLAVNVRLPRPPVWLAQVITDTVDDLAAYPRTEAAVAAIATAHQVARSAVLPTAGGAEAFTLLARARTWRRPVIVHPQFTEPEAALLAAGYQPERVITDAVRGFVLEPDRVPDDADLVIIGNPTNPTGVLHPAATIAQLVRPGRVVCVDEAFMDAVPGEPESMITGELAGVVVLRSLTKTWGLAGLRAGYAVGDPQVIEDLRRQQPPWSVSTPALAVIAACLTPEARAEAAAGAIELTQRRELLVGALGDLGLRVVHRGRAPFVLVDTRPWDRDPDSVRISLREQGFAVRRGDTFPGLSADWMRIAVRDPETIRALAKALLVIKALPVEALSVQKGGA